MQHGKAIRKSAKSTAADKTDTVRHRQQQTSENNNYSPASAPQAAEQPPANAEWSWTHGQTSPPQTTTNEPPYQPLQSDGLPPIAWTPPRSRHHHPRPPPVNEPPPSTIYPTSVEQQQTTARFAFPLDQSQTPYEQPQQQDQPLSDARPPPPEQPPPPPVQRKITPQRRQLFDPQQLAYISAAAARYAAEQNEQQSTSTAVTPFPTAFTEQSYPHPAVTVVPVGTSPPSCDPRKCLLPDCYCDGRMIPGGFDKKDTPQFVLVTFDDGVSELNYDLYMRLFNRKNPNGCPIRGTFFLSHEWTDYGMVQNLYSMGHEIASHTIS